MRRLFDQFNLLVTKVPDKHIGGWMLRIFLTPAIDTVLQVLPVNLGIFGDFGKLYPAQKILVAGWFLVAVKEIPRWPDD